MKSWNEIRKAATAFSKRRKNAYDEKAQAQSFLKEFFAVFGVNAVTVATFEHRVKFADGSQLCKVSVSQFYGIEIEQFPAEIAKVALWLMDHLCNMEVADRFGQYFARIPIKDSPHIVCANALTMDWGSLLNVANVEMLPIANSNSQLKTGNIGTGNTGNNSTFSYIFGNPPFLGASSNGMDAAKKADMLTLFPKNKNLDFVCGWYKKANDIIQGAATRCEPTPIRSRSAQARR